MASKRRTTLPRNSARPVSRAAPPAPQPVRRGGIPRLWIGIIAGVAVLATIGLVALGALTRGGENNEEALAAAPPAVVDADRGRGSVNAPVKIVEYADMQCPACGVYTRDIEPQIINEYVNAGLVRLEYEHYQFLGAESFRAAEASECAADQGQFVRFREILFNAQNGENRGGFRDSRLKELATGAGLDTAAFNACLDSGRYTDKVKNESAQARLLGIKSTPTFNINGRRIEGVGPYASFKQVIEQALTGAGVQR